jgi:hypothetical protein
MKQTNSLLQKALDSITSEEEFSGQSKKILSVVFLLISCLLSFQSIVGTRLFFFPKDISIAPDLLSATIALALVVPLYGRGILKWSSSIYGLMMFVLLLAVFSSISKLAYAGGGEVSLYLIAIAVVLSWLGVRAIAGIVWVLVFIAGVYSATKISTEMGITGFIFITTSFLGLLMHTNLSPTGIVNGMTDEYSGFAKTVQKTVSEDIRKTREKFSGDS